LDRNRRTGYAYHVQHCQPRRAAILGGGFKHRLGAGLPRPRHRMDHTRQRRRDIARRFFGCCCSSSER
jgi:hypothetical protein